MAARAQERDQYDSSQCDAAGELRCQCTKLKLTNGIAKPATLASPGWLPAVPVVVPRDVDPDLFGHEANIGPTLLAGESACALNRIGRCSGGWEPEGYSVPSLSNLAGGTYLIGGGRIGGI